MLTAPEFWWRPKSLPAWLLSPLALAYGEVARARMERDGARASLPIICIGNFVTGGAGKTPIAMAVAEIAAWSKLLSRYLLPRSEAPG